MVKSQSPRSKTTLKKDEHIGVISDSLTTSKVREYCKTVKTPAWSIEGENYFEAERLDIKGK